MVGFYPHGSPICFLFLVSRRSFVSCFLLLLKETQGLKARASLGWDCRPLICLLSLAMPLLLRPRSTAWSSISCFLAITTLSELRILYRSIGSPQVWEELWSQAEVIENTPSIRAFHYSKQGHHGGLQGDLGHLNMSLAIWLCFNVTWVFVSS